MTVRVRFAPSPTGEPHVGNIRTAIFNWLFARRHGGTFILRIEDTDVVRAVPGALEAIEDALRWLGLDWDEGPGVGGPYGPYIQSQRTELYRAVADRLVAEGYAYLCYCSPERLDEMRKEQMRRREPPRYDRRCRDLAEEGRRRFEADGIVPVVRFRTPLSGETVVHDLIRGEVTFDNGTLDDFVLLKSDGYPTYHLANVADDHHMRITHVLRADEWLPSTPRHVLMYQALGYEPPLFAHLPMILGPDRSKLSKRHGATSVSAYMERGYLPEALFNFLTLLGWSLDDSTEIISRQDLVRHFSLERVSKSAAVFNIDKLNWMNGVYIRQLEMSDLGQRMVPFLERDLPPLVPRPVDREYLDRITPLVQERLKLLSEAAELTSFFFADETEYESGLLLGRRLDLPTAQRALRTTLGKLTALSPWDAPTLEGVIRSLAEDLSLRTGDYFGLLRVAVTGRTAAPPLFETMAVLGRERCLRRLEAALAKLAA